MGREPSTGRQGLRGAGGLHEGIHDRTRVCVCVFAWSVALNLVALDSAAAAVGVREKPGFPVLHCICTDQCRTVRCSQTDRKTSRAAQQLRRSFLSPLFLPRSRLRFPSCVRVFVCSPSSFFHPLFCCACAAGGGTPHTISLGRGHGSTWAPPRTCFCGLREGDRLCCLAPALSMSPRPVSSPLRGLLSTALLGSFLSRGSQRVSLSLCVCVCRGRREDAATKGPTESLVCACTPPPPPGLPRDDASGPPPPPPLSPGPPVCPRCAPAECPPGTPPAPERQPL